jgi:hypothetical protein
MFSSSTRPTDREIADERIVPLLSRNDSSIIEVMTTTTTRECHSCGATDESLARDGFDLDTVWHYDDLCQPCVDGQNYEDL